MRFELEEAYQGLIRFAYTSFDRLVIRGLVPVMQRPAGFVTWARSLLPGAPIEASWIQSLSRRFHAGVQSFAQERGIPVLRAPKGRRKHLIAEEHRARVKPENGVYVILRSRESAPVFESRRRKVCPNPIHRDIVRRDGYIDYYYFYVIDKYWGPISLKIASHAPFNVTVFLNGNRWLACEAARQGLRLGAKGNSITACADPAALQEISDSLSWQRIQSVCDHWAYHVFPVFTAEDRRRSRFRYQWFVVQAEMSHNMLFKNPKRLTSLFEQHVDRNRRLLHPRTVKSIFCKVPTGSYKSEVEVEVRHAFGGLTILRTRYGRTLLKQYNNQQRTFRTEVCTNDPTDLYLRKGIQNLDALRQRLLELMAHFQSAQAPILETSCHRGELTALAEPGRVNDTPTAGIRLENERVMAALAALPQLAHRPGGFRSAEMRDLVQRRLGRPYSSSQASYDLRKLRGKRLVETVPGRRRYRATREGIRVAVLLLKLREELLEPVLAAGRRRPPRRDRGEPDCYYLALAQDVRRLCDYLCLRAA
jgi:hypothetical protein